MTLLLFISIFTGYLASAFILGQSISIFFFFFVTLFYILTLFAQSSDLYVPVYGVLFLLLSEAFAIKYKTLSTDQVHNFSNMTLFASVVYAFHYYRNDNSFVADVFENLFISSVMCLAITMLIKGIQQIMNKLS
ncbi:hypothetical protein ACSLBF_21345 (plasmid) [Pseudoalteromonas sp. T1lg65]|uniref:hypothetical protein n=1 Tax=Pseudoalteromonas sp. T1lg65 TaxID=2077101 RepID=UPI003F7A9DF1